MKERYTSARNKVEHDSVTKKEHFKLYKSGKLWLVAGLASFAFAGTQVTAELQQPDVKADTTAEADSASSSTLQASAVTLTSATSTAALHSVAADSSSADSSGATTVSTAADSTSTASSSASTASSASSAAVAASSVTDSSVAAASASSTAATTDLTSQLGLTGEVTASLTDGVLTITNGDQVTAAEHEAIVAYVESNSAITSVVGLRPEARDLDADGNYIPYTDNGEVKLYESGVGQTLHPAASYTSEGYPVVTGYPSINSGYYLGADGKQYVIPAISVGNSGIVFATHYDTTSKLLYADSMLADSVAVSGATIWINNSMTLNSHTANEVTFSSDTAVVNGQTVPIYYLSPAQVLTLLTTLQPDSSGYYRIHVILPGKTTETASPGGIRIGQMTIQIPVNVTLTSPAETYTSGTKASSYLGSVAATTDVDGNATLNATVTTTGKNGAVTLTVPLTADDFTLSAGVTDSDGGGSYSYTLTQDGIDKINAAITTFKTTSAAYTAMVNATTGATLISYNYALEVPTGTITINEIETKQITETIAYGAPSTQTSVTVPVGTVYRTVTASETGTPVYSAWTTNIDGMTTGDATLTAPAVTTAQLNAGTPSGYALADTPVTTAATGADAVATAAAALTDNSDLVINVSDIPVDDTTVTTPITVTRTVNYKSVAAALTVTYEDVTDPTHPTVATDTVTGVVGGNGTYDTTTEMENNAALKNYELASGQATTVDYSMAAATNTLTIQVVHKTTTVASTDATVNKSYTVTVTGTQTEPTAVIDTQTFNYQRTGTTDLVTTLTTYTDWTLVDSTQTYTPVTPDQVAGYTTTITGPTGITSTSNTTVSQAEFQAALTAFIADDSAATGDTSKSINFNVTYTPTAQVLTVQYVDDDDNENVVKTDTSITGVTGQNGVYSADASDIKNSDGVAGVYKLADNQADSLDYTLTATGETLTVHVAHIKQTATSNPTDETTNKTFTVNITGNKPNSAENPTTTPINNSQTLSFQRSKTTDLVTGDITYGDWTAVSGESTYSPFTIASVAGYKTSIASDDTKDTVPGASTSDISISQSDFQNALTDFINDNSTTSGATDDSVTFNVAYTDNTTDNPAPTNTNDPNYKDTHKTFVVHVTVTKPAGTSTDVSLPSSETTQTITLTRDYYTDNADGTTVVKYGKWQIPTGEYNQVTPVTSPGYTAVVTPDSDDDGTITQADFQTLLQTFANDNSDNSGGSTTSTSFAITYNADGQESATVDYVDINGTTSSTLYSEPLSGDPGTAISFDTQNWIQHFEDLGYVLVDDGTANGGTYSATKQTFTVTFKHDTGTPYVPGPGEALYSETHKNFNVDVTATGYNVTIPNATQTLAYQRTVTLDKVTSQPASYGDWTPVSTATTDGFKDVTAPDVPDYTATLNPDTGSDNAVTADDINTQLTAFIADTDNKDATYGANFKYVQTTITPGDPGTHASELEKTVTSQIVYHNTDGSTSTSDGPTTTLYRTGTLNSDGVTFTYGAWTTDPSGDATKGSATVTIPAVADLKTPTNYTATVTASVTDNTTSSKTALADTNNSAVVLTPDTTTNPVTVTQDVKYTQTTLTPEHPGSDIDNLEMTVTSQTIYHNTDGTTTTVAGTPTTFYRTATYQLNAAGTAIDTTVDPVYGDWTTNADGVPTTGTDSVTIPAVTDLKTPTNYTATVTTTRSDDGSYTDMTNKAVKVTPAETTAGGTTITVTQDVKYTQTTLTPTHPGDHISDLEMTVTSETIYHNVDGTTTTVNGTPTTFYRTATYQTNADGTINDTVDPVYGDWTTNADGVPTTGTDSVTVPAVTDLKTPTNYTATVTTTRSDDGSYTDNTNKAVKVTPAETTAGGTTITVSQNVNYTQTTLTPKNPGTHLSDLEMTVTSQTIYHNVDGTTTTVNGTPTTFYRTATYQTNADGTIDDSVAPVYGNWTTNNDGIPTTGTDSVTVPAVTDLKTPTNYTATVTTTRSDTTGSDTDNTAVTVTPAETTAGGTTITVTRTVDYTQTTAVPGDTALADELQRTATYTVNYGTGTTATTNPTTVTQTFYRQATRAVGATTWTFGAWTTDPSGDASKGSSEFAIAALTTAFAPAGYDYMIERVDTPFKDDGTADSATTTEDVPLSTTGVTLNGNTYSVVLNVSYTAKTDTVATITFEDADNNNAVVGTPTTVTGTTGTNSEESFTVPDKYVLSGTQTATISDGKVLVNFKGDGSENVIIYLNHDKTITNPTSGADTHKSFTVTTQESGATTVNGVDVSANNNTQTLNYSRSETKDAVTGAVVSYGAWTLDSTSTYNAVTPVTVPDYKAVINPDTTSTGIVNLDDIQAALTAFANDTSTDAKNTSFTISYTQTTATPGNPGTVDPSELTTTITYDVNYGAQGTSAPASSDPQQTVTLYRTATLDDTGTVTGYTAWTTNTNGVSTSASDQIVNFAPISDLKAQAGYSASVATTVDGADNGANVVVSLVPGVTGDDSTTNGVLHKVVRTVSYAAASDTDATITYLDDATLDANGNPTVVKTDSVTGTTDLQKAYTITVPSGYVIDSTKTSYTDGQSIEITLKGDTTDNVVVYLTHGSTTDVPTGGPYYDDTHATVTQTIHYLMPDGTTAAAPDSSASLKFTRTIKTDTVTGLALTDASGNYIYGDWTPDTVDSFAAVTSPTVAGYTPDPASVPAVTGVTGDTEDITDTVHYSAGQSSLQVKYVDDTDGSTVSTDSVTGTTGSTGSYTVTVPDKYQLAVGQATSVAYTLTPDDTDNITIHLVHGTTTGTPTTGAETHKSFTVTTQEANGDTTVNGTDVTANNNTQTLNYSRTVTTDNVTGAVESYGAWTLDTGSTYNALTPVTVPDYKAVIDPDATSTGIVNLDDIQAALTAFQADTGDTAGSAAFTISYKQTTATPGNPGTVDPSELTTTITYDVNYGAQGTSAPASSDPQQTVTLYRTATLDDTGTVTGYTAWTTNTNGVSTSASDQIVNFAPISDLKAQAGYSASVATTVDGADNGANVVVSLVPGTTGDDSTTNGVLHKVVRTVSYAAASDTDATITYLDDATLDANGNPTVVKTDSVTGTTDLQKAYTITVPSGYVIDSTKTSYTDGQSIEITLKGDTTDNVVVYLTHGSTTDVPTGGPYYDDTHATVTQTIHYLMPDGTTAAAPDSSASLKFTRTIKTDTVTGLALTDASGNYIYGDWTPDTVDSFAAVTSPTVAGYTPDPASVPAVTGVTGDTEDITDTVHYSAGQSSLQVKYVDDTDGSTVSTDSVSGTTGSTGNYTVTVPDKYQLAVGQATSVAYTLTPDDTDNITIHLVHGTTTGTPTTGAETHKSFTVTTQEANGDTTVNGTDVTANNNTQTLNYSRTVTTDNVTGAVESYGAWTLDTGSTYNALTPVTVPDYKAVIDPDTTSTGIVNWDDIQAALTAFQADTGDTAGSAAFTISYKQTTATPGNPGTVDPSELTTTITYDVNYGAQGTSAPASSDPQQTVTLYRTATLDDTGTVTGYTAWTTNTNGVSTSASDQIVNFAPISDLKAQAGYSASVATTVDGADNGANVVVSLVPGTTGDDSTTNGVLHKVVRTVSYAAASDTDATITYLDDATLDANGNPTVVKTDSVTGTTDLQKAYTITVPSGYVIDSTKTSYTDGQSIEITLKGDTTDNVVVYLTHGSTTDVPTGGPYYDDTHATVTQTIHYLMPDGTTAAAPDSSASLKFTRTIKTDTVTGLALTDASGNYIYGDWTPDTVDSFAAVTSPTVAGYTPDPASVPAVTGVTGDTEDITDTVHYSAGQSSLQVKYVDDTDGSTVSTDSVTGTTGSTGSYTVTVPDKYQLAVGQATSVAYTLTPDDTDNITIHLVHGTTTGTPTTGAETHKSFTVTTQEANGDTTVNGTDVTANNNTQTLNYSRTVTTDNVTGAVESYGAWTLDTGSTYNALTPVTVPDYKAVIDPDATSTGIVNLDDIQAALTAFQADTGDTAGSAAFTISYKQTTATPGNPGTVDPSELTTTITYDVNYGAQGTSAPASSDPQQTVTLYRTATLDDTGTVTGYTTWTTNTNGVSTSASDQIVNFAPISDLKAQAGYSASVATTVDGADNGANVVVSLVPGTTGDDSTTNGVLHKVVRTVSYAAASDTDATITYLDDATLDANGNPTVVKTDSVTGTTDLQKAYTITVPSGYVIDSTKTSYTDGQSIEITLKGDTTDNVVVYLTHGSTTDVPTGGPYYDDTHATVTQTIHYLMPDGTTAAAPDSSASLKFTRTIKTDTVTGLALTDASGNYIYGDWTPDTVDSFAAVTSPTVAGYTPDPASVPAVTGVTGDTEDITDTVHYSAGQSSLQVKYVDDTDGSTVSTDSVTGTTGSTGNYTVTVPDKYQLAVGQASSVAYTLTPDDTDNITIHLVHGTDTGTPTIPGVDYDQTHKSFTVTTSEANGDTTINGTDVTANNNTQTLNYSRTETTDKVTGAVESYGAWTLDTGATYNAVTPVTVPDYKAVIDPDTTSTGIVNWNDIQAALTAFQADTSNTAGTAAFTISYKQTTATPGNPGTVDPSELTTTITYDVNYGDPVNSSATQQTVTLYRTATLDDTGAVTGYTAWTTNTNGVSTSASDQVVSFAPVTDLKAQAGYSESIATTLDGLANGANDTVTIVPGVTGDDSTANGVLHKVVRNVTYTPASDTDATITYRDSDTGDSIVRTDTVTGTTGLPVSYTVTVPSGYVIDTTRSSAYTDNTAFDITLQGGTGDNVVIYLKHGSTTVPPTDPTHTKDTNASVTETINYVKADGTTAAPSVTKTLAFTRNITIDSVTGAITERDPWQATNGTSFDAVTSPILDGYTADQDSIAAVTGVTGDDSDITYTVTYTPNTDTAATITFEDISNNNAQVGSQVPLTGTTDTTVQEAFTVPDGYVLSSVQTATISGGNVAVTFKGDGSTNVVIYLTHNSTTITPGQTVTQTGDPIPGPSGKTYGDYNVPANTSVTRTVTYHYANGNSAGTTVTQTANYERTVTVDEVTGDITGYGAWTLVSGSSDSFAEVDTPIIAGYTPTKTTVNAETVTATTANETVDVLYLARTDTTEQIKYVDSTDGTVKTDTVAGTTDTTTPYTVNIPAGYVIDSSKPNNSYTNGQVLTINLTADDAGDVTIYLTHGSVNNVPTTGEDHYSDTHATVTQTINYVKADGTTAFTSVTNSLSFERTIKTDAVTGLAIADASGNFTYGAWTPVAGTSFAAVTSTPLAGYTVDTPTVAEVDNVSGDTPNITDTVTYTPDANTTATVTYKSLTDGSVVGTDTITGNTDSTVDYQAVAPTGYKLSPVQAVTLDANNKVNITLKADNSDNIVIFVQHGTTIVNPGPGPYADATTKTVTETINYQATGRNAASVTLPASTTKTVTFTRNVTIDSVTGDILSYGDWNATSENFDDVTSPSVTGWTPDTATVSGSATPSDRDENHVVTVTYTQDPVTVTATPKGPNGETISTPIVVTGVPGDPINQPSVPGYTPVGTVTIPDNGTEVNIPYTADAQTATINYVDLDAKASASSIGTPTTVTGVSNGDVSHTDIATAIAALEAAGYVLNTDGSLNQKFDTDDAVNQVFTVTFNEKTVDITPGETITKTGDPIPGPSGKTYGDYTSDVNATVTRTINYKYANGTTAKASVTQTANFTRTITVNEVTGEVTSTGAWTATAGSDALAAVTTPTIDGYTPTETSVAAETVTGDSSDETVNVIYLARNDTTEKIKYVNAAGTVVHTDTVAGTTDSSAPYTIAVPTGYVIDPSKSNYTDGQTINVQLTADDAGDVTIYLKNGTKTVPSTDPKYTKDTNASVTETVNYVKTDGTTAAPAATQTLDFTRDIIIDTVTGEILSRGAWVPTTGDSFAAVASPVVAGYTPDQTSVAAITGVTGDDTNVTKTVTYTPNVNTTATITYKDVKTGDTVGTATVTGTTDTTVAYTLSAPAGYAIAKAQVATVTDGKVDVTLKADNSDDLVIFVTNGSTTITPGETVTKTGDPIPGPSGKTYGDYKDATTQTVKETVNYTATGRNAADFTTPASVTKTVTFTRSVTIDTVTGDITSYGAWNATSEDFDDVTSPTVAGWTPDKTTVAGSATPTTDDQTVTVTYTQNSKTVTVTPKGPNGETIGTPTEVTGVPGDPITGPSIPGYTPSGTTTIPDNGTTVDLPYTADTLSATVNYVDEDGNKLADPTTLSGKTAETVDHTAVAAVISALKAKGYAVVSDPTTSAKFDNDDNQAQTFNVILKQGTTVVTPPTNTTDKYYDATHQFVTETINYTLPNGSQAAESTVNTLAFTRDITVNSVTGAIVAYGDWTPTTTDTFAAVTAPTVEGYTPTTATIAARTVSAEDDDVTINDSYTGATHSYTITPVDQNGNPIGNPIVVTGKTGDPVSVPSIDGYTPDGNQTLGTVPAGDSTVEVVYQKNQTTPTAEASTTAPVVTSTQTNTNYQPATTTSAAKKLPQTGDANQSDVTTAGALGLVASIATMVGLIGVAKKRKDEED